MRSNYKVQSQEEEDSENVQETSLQAREPNPNPWNLKTELKFPCPMNGHKHEVSKCKEFFYLSPEDRWEKLEKGRMCFSCLKPRGVCKLRKCVNHPKVPKVLKWAQYALWAESKGLAPFSIFFCKRKEYGESRATPSELKIALEKYIGKLARGIAEANILFAVNFMLQ